MYKNIIWATASLMAVSTGLHAAETHDHAHDDTQVRVDHHDHSSHQEGHDHGHYYTHPVLNESPTPDTKLQARYIFVSADEEDEHEIEVHGEYALSQTFSLEIALPFVKHDDEIEMGNLHGGIKIANFAYEDAGITLTTMLLFEAPTGDSEEGGHHGGDDWTVGIHIGGGWKNDVYEFIAFTGLENPISTEEESENSWSTHASLLRHHNDFLALVFELEYDRVMNGHESGEDSGFFTAGAVFKPQTKAHTEWSIGLSVPITDGHEADFRFICGGLIHF